MSENMKQPTLLKEIFNQIKEAVRAGKLKKGDALPVERVWAVQLGVSRTALRETIKSMELLGLVECVQGAGNFISNHLSHAFSEPLSLMFMLEAGTSAHILEFRQSIEMVAARKTAVVISAEHLEKLEAIWRRMGDDAAPEQLSKWDQQFHRLIVEETGNPLMITMMNSAEILIQEQIRGARSLLMSDAHALETIQAQHQGLLEAFRAHSPEKAVAAITAHLDFVSDYMLKQTGQVENT